jgi:hypothetical protein
LKFGYQDYRPEKLLSTAAVTAGLTSDGASGEECELAVDSKADEPDGEEAVQQTPIWAAQLQKLPDDVNELIFSYLEAEAVGRCCCVWKYWAVACRYDGIWHQLFSIAHASVPVSQQEVCLILMRRPSLFTVPWCPPLGSGAAVWLMENRHDSYASDKVFWGILCKNILHSRA